MKKLCVLSSNNHPGYLFFIPIVEWVWNKFGLEIALFVTSDVTETETNHRSSSTTLHIIPDIENVRTGTLAQTVRHFTADVLPRDAYIMVQDIDLIPLKNWWQPDLSKPSISGYPEMTGGQFIPVHYTGMTGQQWYDLMDCTGDLKADMEAAMKANGRAYGKEWQEYWDTDWDILTQKVRARPAEEFNWITRGMVNGLPFGRVDRSTIVVDKETGAYSWGSSGNIPEKLDLHAEWNNSSAPEKWKSIKSEMEKAFGGLPEWMDQHAAEHFKKYGHG